ncbi:uncharacterized protein LOC126235289 [Schistocerca nitens]|uniref:uncharacterized protein LOC126235289 n=1 Tax=Schistocerca nitens TaxID=7011 RepID=UPI002117F3B9|nr:uncharacterized protein LOC126235289 [Schistocerca nitens]
MPDGYRLRHCKLQKNEENQKSAVFKCKEVEDNNRMEKTRELYNKIRDIEGNSWRKSEYDEVNVLLELEPDILESEVKWALENNVEKKTSGYDGIPAELSKVIGKHGVKMLHSICQKIWST